MTILIVTGIFPPDIGGPATYVPLVARALTERGHRVVVLTTSEPGHVHLVGGHPFRVLRIDRRLPVAARTLRLAARLAHEAGRADVVYAAGMLLEATVATRLRGTPLVAKIVGDPAWERSVRRRWTGDDFDRFQTRRQTRPAEAAKAFRSWSVRRAERVIVPSEYLRRVVVSWGAMEERVDVVGNAVRTLAEPAPRPVTDRLRLLTAARLVPWKGIGSIIRAIRQLPEASLEVVGEGPCRGEWEALARSLGVADRVIFTGTLPPDELEQRMRAHDVFVLASRYEGLPHVLLEAMAAGLAVVATRAGGTAELVRDGDTGLLVEPNEEALYAALARLCRDAPLRQRLGARGRVYVGAGFGLAGMIDRTERCLLEAREAHAARLRERFTEFASLGSDL